MVCDHSPSEYQEIVDGEIKEVVRCVWCSEKLEGVVNKELSNEILQLLLTRNKAEATELIVKDIMDTNHIYTTRDDDNSEMWIYDKGIYIPQGKTFIQERCRLILGDVYTTNLCNQVISKIEADTFIDQDEFFNIEHKELIPVENGLLNVVEKALYPFTPKLIFFNKIPVKFDSEAKCENIENFFKGIVKNVEDVKVIEEIFGFVLYDEYFVEKAVMLFGDGRNGKGKLLELLKIFLGIESCTEISLEDLENDMFSLGELFKKRANLCGDISRTALANTGNFKKLTGRDLIAGARKFKNRVTFKNTAKMVFSANELPITYDTTPAFWNRWVIIDFPYRFLTQEDIDKLNDKDKVNVKLRDTKIIEKIVTPEELSGLLNVALNGLERMLQKENFSKSLCAEDVKNIWMRRSDSCVAFVMDCIERKYQGHITKEEFKARYTKYCFEHGLKISHDKRIISILTTQVGAFSGRKNIDGKQEHIWIGVDFKESKKSSQASQGSHGFSPYIRNSKFPIESKTLTTLTSLTNSTDNKITDDDIDDELKKGGDD